MEWQGCCYSSVIFFGKPTSKAVAAKDVEEAEGIKGREGRGRRIVCALLVSFRLPPAFSALSAVSKRVEL